jgi:hypothetical protein
MAVLKKPKRCDYCGRETPPFVSKTCCRVCYDYNRKAARDGHEPLPKLVFPTILTLDEAREEQRRDREKNGEA